MSKEVALNRKVDWLLPEDGRDLPADYLTSVDKVVPDRLV